MACAFDMRILADFFELRTTLASNRATMLISVCLVVCLHALAL